MRLVTHSQGVWKIWKAGRAPHFMDAAADLWREIPQGAVKAEGMELKFDMTWVPPHKSMADVDQGVISDFDRVGNDWADQSAKRGAKLHTLGVQPVKRYQDDLARAVAWLRDSVWVHGVCNPDRS